jgi:hypothetical protein
MEKEKELPSEMLVAEALIRLKALENVLIAAGVVTQDALNQEIKKLNDQLSRVILEKAQVSGNIDEIIKNLNKKSTDN